MPTTSRRRNGSQASCEPCRQAKIGCSHEWPICGCCRRRAIESKCWYHPAPLAKKQGRPKQPKSRPSTESSMSSQNLTLIGSENSIDASMKNPVGRSLKCYAWPFISNYPSGIESRTPLQITADGTSWKKQLECAVEIVSQLRFITLVSKSIEEYLSFSQVSLVPRPIILQLLVSVQDSLSVFSHTEQDMSEQSTQISQQVTSTAEAILRSSTTDIAITSSLDLKDFCGLFSGENLRLETLGLLYTIAGRALLCGSDCNRLRHKEFIRQIIWCSNTSLRLAHELAPQMNDLIIWLAYENLQLTSILKGDEGLQVWRRFGDLATDIFALGLHREETYALQKVPAFLAETRRKTFAAAYHLDKVFASVYHRPPKISKRYSDCKMPLDLSDDDLLACSLQSSQMSEVKLTPEGWNIERDYRATTWARVRFILATFREEAIEKQFQPIATIQDADLRSLIDRCQLAWNSLPQHLKYSSECWSSDIPSNVCMMLGKVYLSYLHINFQIYQLSAPYHYGSRQDLLDVSVQMLETVIEMVNSQTNAHYSPKDLPQIVRAYGLPSASLLMSTLEDATYDLEKCLPTSISHASLIRKLSVFVSHLQSVPNRGESNYVFFTQAANAISYKLDHFLDSAVKQTIPTIPSVVWGENSSSVILNPDEAQPTPILPVFEDLEHSVENWAMDWGLDLASVELNSF
ncbi:hypothetical protein F4824DRAFT_515086 [Ustulina deusta]|nr:hypothetical protein F4824DRAFT_515086 [Ustulina deusta]